MFRRLIQLPETQSFFLFGPRGTGKTTLLTQQFKLEPNPPPGVRYINLLDPQEEDRFSRSPGLLKEIIEENPKQFRRIIVDEVQKVLQLLDVVHLLLEKYKRIQFIMSGSSARKLKHGGANLLAGRAFSFHLHPLSFLEIGSAAKLFDLLAWGSLPKIFEFTNLQDKRRFLSAYTQTYLKQEIQLEQLVRNIVSFRVFLDIAAQANGEIVNFYNIAKQTGVDDKTVARYFEILIDTMVGFYLEPYDESVRVRQREKPKFFLFDTGVQRALTQMLEVELKESANEYGRLFEHFVICECKKLNDYFERDFRFYYLRTKDGAEIDLIVKKPRNKKFLIEIKSTKRVLPEHYANLLSLGKALKHEQMWVICNEVEPRLTKEGVRIMPWREGLRELFEN